jgi:hypothetical protein
MFTGEVDLGNAVQRFLRDSGAQARLLEALGKLTFGDNDTAEFRRSRLAELRDAAAGDGFIPTESLAMGERLGLVYQKRAFGGSVHCAEIEVARTVGNSDNDQPSLTVMSSSGNLLRSNFTGIPLEAGVTVGLGYWDGAAGRAGEFYYELALGTELAHADEVRQPVGGEQQIQGFDLYSGFTLQQAYYHGQPLFPEHD